MGTVTLGVGSGKGGVGKSTLTLNLALLFAQDGLRVGLLDADVYGPSIPLMLNLKRTAPARGWLLAGTSRRRRIEPVERLGIKVMSMAFAVPENHPLAWDGGLVRVLVSQLCREVDWGALDLLIIDMPPGTGDVHQALTSAAGLTGVILVVSPQDVAHLDARRSLELYRRQGIPVLGGIENMSALICPHCRSNMNIFRPVQEARALWAAGVDRLGSIPLDPLLSESQDGGNPVVLAHPSAPSVTAIRQVVTELKMRLWR